MREEGNFNISEMLHEFVSANSDSQTLSVLPEGIMSHSDSVIDCKGKAERQQAFMSSQMRSSCRHWAEFVISKM